MIGACMTEGYSMRCMCRDAVGMRHCAQVKLAYHVRVLVPCYKEELDIVQRTVLAALAAHLPGSCARTVYLCDDGKDAEKRRWVANLGRSDLVYVSGARAAHRGDERQERQPQQRHPPDLPRGAEGLPACLPARDSMCIHAFSQKCGSGAAMSCYPCSSCACGGVLCGAAPLPVNLPCMHAYLRARTSKVFCTRLLKETHF